MSVTKPKPFELFLFTTDTAVAAGCMDVGVDAIIVDWENSGKHERQRGFNTQINQQSSADLRAMREAVPGTIICRINGYNNNTTQTEVEEAITNGADEILLPMVRNLQEAEQVITWIKGRCRFGILVETDAAVTIAGQLALLPLSRVYIGLNDLHIDKKLPNLFYPFIDGTIEYLRSVFCNIPFGVGGLTHAASGSPVLSSLLMNQYALLQTDFTFLRRTFLNDLQFAASPRALITDIKNGIHLARNSSVAIQKQKEGQMKNIISFWRPYELAESESLHQTG